MKSVFSHRSSNLPIYRLSHPHIIAYKEAFFEDSTSSLCIVMEYADGGDLMALISKHSKNSSHIPESELWRFFVQIVAGLKTLHDRRILHRDLKVGVPHNSGVVCQYVLDQGR